MSHMRWAPVLAVALAAAQPAAAEGPAYAFDIARSVQVGAPFAAVKGQVFYRETSAGQDATFLAEALTGGAWPVTIPADEPLTRLTFEKRGLLEKNKEVAVYCPDKFGDAVQTPGAAAARPTLCLEDADGDGAFERAYAAQSAIGALASLSFAAKPLPLAPLRMVKRRYAPESGREGVVELRYDGMIGRKLVITALAHITGLAAPAYEQQLEFDAPAAGDPLQLTIEHPVFAAPAYRAALGQRPPSGAARPAPAGFEPAKPVPMMTLTLQNAAAEALSGTIVSPYPDWVWYQQTCGASEAPTKCERITWRQDQSLVTLAPRAQTAPR